MEDVQAIMRDNASSEKLARLEFARLAEGAEGVGLRKLAEAGEAWMKTERFRDYYRRRQSEKSSAERSV